MNLSNMEFIGELNFVEEDENFILYTFILDSRDFNKEPAPHLYIKNKEILVSLGSKMTGTFSLKRAIDFWVRMRMTGKNFFEYKIFEQE